MIENETIKVLGEEFEFVPYKGVSGFHRVEVVSAKTFVDGQSDREMLYHKHLFREAVSGEYEVLYYVPFGLAAVSG